MLLSEEIFVVGVVVRLDYLNQLGTTKAVWKSELDEERTLWILYLEELGNVDRLSVTSGNDD